MMLRNFFRKRTNLILFFGGLIVVSLLIFNHFSTKEENYTDADAAASDILIPTKSQQYYVAQGIRYFRTMESSVSMNIKPNYADKVIRWEWHPWLLLTGYTRINLIWTDILLKLYPTKYDTIDCKYFDKQPFCRCHVMFNYSGKRIPIYEEFTFNNQGEITFIEAWSDFPSLLPMDKKDYWAEAENVNRLSTRVPGLGNSKSKIYLKAPWMLNAAKKDTVLADMLYRIKHPFIAFMKELQKQKKEMEQADKPPIGDVFPYYP